MSSTKLKFKESDPKKAEDLLAHLAIAFPIYTFGHDPSTGGFIFDSNGHGGSRANVYIIKQSILGYMNGFAAGRTLAA